MLKLKFDPVFGIIHEEIKGICYDETHVWSSTKPKQFDFPLRYYNPEEDEKENRKSA